MSSFDLKYIKIIKKTFRTVIQNSSENGYFDLIFFIFSNDCVNDKSLKLMFHLMKIFKNTI